MIAARVMRDRIPALELLLQKLNKSPGVVDPANPLFPFGEFDTLHVARFVVLDDQTLADRPEHPPLQFPVWLAFLGDCDGDADRQLQQFVTRARDGLTQIFQHSDDFSPDTDLLQWMRAHSVKPAAQYVNWVGRTVKRIREEANLREALRDYLRTQNDAPAAASLDLRNRLVARQKASGPALTPDAPTPWAWQLRQIGSLCAALLIGALLAVPLLIASPLLIYELRRREEADPEIAPRPNPQDVEKLAALEDHAVANQFSAFGDVKPGKFRLWLLLLVFQALDFSTRHIYTRGRLARVGTIHFARWVFLDDKRRLFFASNYDGSLDSYMDDFINKVAFGLNLVFSNGIGWPKTRFLIFGGAKRELQFKYYLQRHQLPSQVWYKAYPELTAADLARNTMIREGLQRSSMSDAEARKWLALI